jgi:hypothetical protein
MKTMHRLFLQLAVFAVIALLPISAFAQQTGIQFYRPADQRGVYIFETPKEDTVAFRGLSVKWGAAFTQQFQSLSHENTPITVDGAVVNPLIGIGTGFNLATANLNMDAQLADGIRVNLITYLSSRHHPEAWVKGGFFQIDKLPMFNSQALDNLFEYLTLRVGHFEINYGDGHFRRTDNGNAMHNPFVGNYILDAFTTEIGAEAYVRANGFLAMVGVTGGEIQGGLIKPNAGKRAPSILGKIGYDSQITPDLRGRLTGSVYTTSSSARNTLYGGDRAGSRYYLAMDAPGSSPAAAFTSGRINPGLVDQITAVQINPFIKYRGLELFGIIEFASGSNHAETAADVTRSVNHYVAEALYRFGPREQIYLGGRYNVLSGEIASNLDVSVDRIQIGGGWFVTPNILAKVEYVNQSYNDFPGTPAYQGGRLHEGRFNGIMVEGVVAF